MALRFIRRNILSEVQNADRVINVIGMEQSLAQCTLNCPVCIGLWQRRGEFCAFRLQLGHVTRL